MVAPGTGRKARSKRKIGWSSAGRQGGGAGAARVRASASFSELERQPEVQGAGWLGGGGLGSWRDPSRREGRITHQQVGW